MRLIIIIGVAFVAGCTATIPTAPQANDLCLRAPIHFSEWGYTLTAGRYSYSGFTPESTLYEVRPSMEGAGRLHKPSDKEFTRNIEAFWDGDTNADLCVNVMRGRTCVNVQNLQACG